MKKTITPAQLKAAVPASLRHSLRSTHWFAHSVVRHVENLRFTGKATPHIHVLRDHERKRNWSFFTWLQETYPEQARLFRHTTTHDRNLAPLPGAALFIPWLQDPVRERWLPLYNKVVALEETYGKLGVPVVNSVRMLSNSIKSRALNIIRNEGVRTAHSLHISPETSFEEVATALGLPFIVRNDVGHGGAVHLVQSADDYHTITWSQLPYPVALEYIDTTDAEGYYRKYRYVMMGNEGKMRSLVITPKWMAHSEDRVMQKRFLDEERTLLRTANPHHALFNRLRKRLKFDFVAFDYAFDAQEQLVVWEPNPFPVIIRPYEWQHPELTHHHEAATEIFEMMLWHYLSLAGMAERCPVRPKIAEEAVACNEAL
ncbi:Glutathione synthase/RimK-type ligase, ATP-grasp superfamily [Catalinimonas alkaloidigena]|uniref:Glutathione synthase/RimK-type ligase, ATP-grasp superfamily n=1 Tax=Catalinimonas alkaloidigena TaxID=1075417 RepID=A0A1G9DGR7_9BACT|nr:hypothetical protein [Catalinimonas alkaloidigena]SDK62974.1 Glutathione synthase/RimK-type ligase, ATP-grasp superfamily [Catalinimonas alkaloidigena]